MYKHKPSLACDAVLDNINYPVMGFPKIDGVRLMHLIGTATGRSLNPHANLYTTTRFSHSIYTGIDGEATYGDITSKSLCRDTNSVLTTIEGEPHVIWNAFDFLREDTISLIYANRIKALESYIRKYKPNDVRIIPHVLLKNEIEVLSFYNECLKKGYEGIILRDPLGHHKNGRCTVNEGWFLRLKPSSDKDAIVLKIIEAQKNLNIAKKNMLGYTERSSHRENKIGKGMVGLLICRDILSGQIINVGPGKMSHAERLYYFDNPTELINEPIKYRSVDTGLKDAPRFARYICRRSRDDISI